MPNPSGAAGPAPPPPPSRPADPCGGLYDPGPGLIKLLQFTCTRSALRCLATTRRRQMTTQTRGLAIPTETPPSSASHPALRHRDLRPLTESISGSTRSVELAAQFVGLVLAVQGLEDAAPSPTSSPREDARPAHRIARGAASSPVAVDSVAHPFLRAEASSRAMVASVVSPINSRSLPLSARAS